MRTCLIINENAGTAGQATALHRVVDGNRAITCWRSTEAGDGIEAAQRALDDGYDCIVAAGGDGTINEVLNGMMRHGGTARLGIVPLGTGNDLARTLDVPLDPRDAIALVQSGAASTLDLFKADDEQKTVYGINAAAGGFSGQVDEIMTEEVKKSWGPLSYLFGAANVLPELREYETFIAFDDGPEEELDVLNVVVANGRTAAGGRRVAPLANPCDGLLDVVIVKWGTMLDLAEVAARLMAANYLDSEHVLHRKVKQLRVRSDPGMWFNVDGELFTKEPLMFSVLPGAIEVVTGPAFRPEPVLSEAA